jgi:endothelin-converting enzyme
VAAHELTHAFDNTGSQYDERGQLVPTDGPLCEADWDLGRLRQWWTNSTVEAFEARAQCVSKQYSQYYVLDAQGNKVHVNGNVSNII